MKCRCFQKRKHSVMVPVCPALPHTQVLTYSCRGAIGVETQQYSCAAASGRFGCVPVIVRCSVTKPNQGRESCMMQMEE